MIKKEKILHSYIFNIVEDEKPKELIIITKQDVSKLIKRLEKSKIHNINIFPNIKKEYKDNCDLFFVLEDIKVSDIDVGIIKNLLSQKIVIFNDFKNDIKIDEMMIKLGFQTELRDQNNKLKCYSYNLKTYNNKRTWNNSKGWANPENFDKFRW
ncbi:MAG: hypothetical protein CMD80_03410 [Gammaproteobacteria bacterium]|nr:hypothetical protein [Gammaproteobacteria bacterium]|tara:strand:+ start:23673 stop:24134 length:462 start_codon:yes stop_codon:yes gene_type:complete